ncbi:translation initiation factor IF-3 [candidate division WWE3 bacterium]|nr:translation initiation factor IF-3 [candidate division WWE3 bacterium]MBT7349233.1 translation initiation factor IF-3 [candidate division WWE3 bacterium]
MKKYYQKNERIRAPKLRVIDSSGENLGELNTKDALAKARENGLDLVVIAETAKPPVAKILDFNKYMYEEKKKASAAKAKSKKSELKEWRFGPSIGKGDLDKKLERTREFLEGNNRVKFTIMLRGRQRAFPNVAKDKLREVSKSLEDIAREEDKIKQQGNRVTVTFVRK